jgi:hypothetical protein
MKALIAMLVVFVTGAMIACGGSGGGGGTATTPQPQPCNNQGLPGSMPNCQYYQNYYNGQMPTSWAYGAWYWPTQYIPTNSTCGCNPGYYPVSGPFGLACAPSAYFNNFSVVYYNWGYWGGAYWNYAQNSGYVNMPQATYTSPTTNACSQSTAQGCDVRMNNCSSGSRCQPIAGGSTIGLCIRY